MNKPSTQAARDSTSAALPHDWMTASLQEIADPTDKFSFRGGPFGSDLKSDDYTNEGVRILQLQDIGEGSFLDKSSVYTSSDKADELIASNIYPGDILLAKMTPVARCCIVPSTQRRYVMCSDGIRLSVDSTRFNREYIFHALNGPGFRREAESKSTGSTRGRIGLSELKAIHLPIPQLPEQQKIAAILTAVDDKLDVIARQIESTQTLKQGLMQPLFSRGVGTQDADGRWVPHAEFKDSELGEIPAGWDVTTVGEVCEVKGGKRLPKGEVLTDENTGFPYIRVTDMYMGGVNTEGVLYVPAHVQPSIARYTISKDDIFISVAGTLGLVGVVPEELDGANLTENADKLTDIKICRDYLFYCLCSDAIQGAIAREGTSNAQPKLALSRIREFSIPLPTRPEQERIAAILKSVGDKLASLQSKQARYQALKRGLMQKLLTGEWRVNVDASATGT